MASITVQVWDATGNKRQDVEMPDDAPVSRLVAVLVDRMKFPQTGPDGQLLSYKLQHRASGKQLLEDQTLSSANVQSGDVVRLIPEITAGRSVRIVDCELRIEPRKMPSHGFSFFASWLHRFVARAFNSQFAIGNSK
ncbi:MAG: EsaB/YukD family protein [Tepidisphaeraceae bacterium]